MSPSGKKALGLVAVVAVLAAVLVAWHYTHLPTNPLVPTETTNVADFDHFQQDLAARVLNQFGGGGNDFSVIVATTAYPLGTLLRAEGSVPADLEDCVPAVPPKPFAAQHLFPSYTMSSDTAMSANLGSGVLEGLSSAGVNLKQSEDVQYTIADAEIQIMDDKSVERVTGQGDCGKYIASHPGMRLIRGAVLGKMTFTVKVDDPASAKAQLSKLGGFSVSDDPGSSSLNVADNQSEPIVELLSEFGSGPSAPGALSMPTPVQTAPSEAPRLKMAPAQSPAHAQHKSSPATQASEAPTGPHMFVQMDAKDSPSSGAKVIQLLHAGWPSANVEPQVQLIPTQKMPDTAQVRYFNQSDAAIANRCLAILQKAYPNARAVRIGLPSPKGQLEVWLPRIKP
jgi:hypothetical protein